jgi:hypothetical protein
MCWQQTNPRSCMRLVIIGSVCNPVFVQSKHASCQSSLILLNKFLCFEIRQKQPRKFHTIKVFSNLCGSGIAWVSWRHLDTQVLWLDWFEASHSMSECWQQTRCNNQNVSFGTKEEKKKKRILWPTNPNSSSSRTCVTSSVGRTVEGREFNALLDC